MSDIKELDVTYLSKYLTPRPKECHKGDFGRVLVIGGSLGYSGAVRLAGNPGMATAGMGDVLSGSIAGLAAQNISLSGAAKLGVLVHAMAGDLSAAEQGERGMIASDLMSYLRRIVSN